MQSPWRIRKPLIFLVLLGLMQSLAAPASEAAENSQAVAVGVGLGRFAYEGVDDFRAAVPSLGLNKNMMGAVYSQVYLEWFPLGEFGFGARQMGSSYAQAGPKYTRLVEVRSTLLTAQWIPLGAEHYARLGLLAGAGRSEYTLSQDSDQTLANVTAVGGAHLVGVYLDWGGESFGARIGVNALKTRLDKINSNFVDGSGQGGYLDLRWAWP